MLAVALNYKTENKHLISRFSLHINICRKCSVSRTQYGKNRNNLLIKTSDVIRFQLQEPLEYLTFVQRDHYMIHGFL